MCADKTLNTFNTLDNIVLDAGKSKDVLPTRVQLSTASTVANRWLQLVQLDRAATVPGR